MSSPDMGVSSNDPRTSSGCRHDSSIDEYALQEDKQVINLKISPQMITIEHRRELNQAVREELLQGLQKVHDHAIEIL